MKTTLAKLRFPSQLSRFINNAESVQFNGDKIVDLFEHLETTYTNVKERVFEDGEQQLRPYFNVFIGKQNINTMDGIYSVIPEGETVSILLARAGG